MKRTIENRLTLVPSEAGGPTAGHGLDHLYQQHVDGVERWVRRLGGPTADVEDLVHDVFMVAWRRRADFRGDASVKTWLFRIAHHVVRGRLRQDRVRRWLLRRHTVELTDRNDAPPSPQDDVQHQEQAARLYRALDKLPDSYRTALILYELEGCTGEQVAQLCNVELGAVWVRLHRGRAKLQKILAREDEP